MIKCLLYLELPVILVLVLLPSLLSQIGGVVFRVVAIVGAATILTQLLVDDGVANGRLLHESALPRLRDLPKGLLAQYFLSVFVQIVLLILGDL